LIQIALLPAAISELLIAIAALPISIAWESVAVLFSKFAAALQSAPQSFSG
jgi:hypothetical protein